jgi:hypothetical protein
MSPKERNPGAASRLAGWLIIAVPAAFVAWLAAMGQGK